MRETFSGQKPADTNKLDPRIWTPLSTVSHDEVMYIACLSLSSSLYQFEWGLSSFLCFIVSYFSRWARNRDWR